MNKYFMHRIKHNKTTDAWDKGIEVKDTLDDARQSYHAYLGAYGYGHDADTDYVQVEVTAETFSDTVADITRRENELVNALRAMLGITAKVHLVAPKSITRSEGKAVRVIDKRKLY